MTDGFLSRDDCEALQGVGEYLQSYHAHQAGRNKVPPGSAAREAEACRLIGQYLRLYPQASRDKVGRLMERQGPRAPTPPPDAAWFTRDFRRDHTFASSPAADRDARYEAAAHAFRDIKHQFTRKIHQRAGRALRLRDDISPPATALSHDAAGLGWACPGGALDASHSRARPSPPLSQLAYVCASKPHVACERPCDP